ncbi:heavy metal translocating P-type ATPase [Pseudomonas sp. F1_0610]|uniref:heavy metal translocating P-type ATPase n=1 Tax=Pseudomonas sp. F1_0610 TaxID=3114284 RepID=UPI0039C0D87B
MSDQKMQVSVQGMSCASCVGRVEKALKSLSQLSDVSVNLVTHKASFSYQAPVVASELMTAVEKAGFTLIEQKLELSIEGMTCSSCVGRVEKSLKDVVGVLEANVNLATQRASVRVLEGVTVDQLVQAVGARGYTAHLIAEGEQTTDELATRQQAEQLQLKKRLIFAAVLAIPLFILEMFSHMIPAMHNFVESNIGMQNSWYFQFVLATLIMFGPGMGFLKTGFKNLVNFAPDMNSLVAVGTTAAYSYSVVATFIPHLLPEGTVNVYYESAGVIVALILLGRFMEAKAKGNTSEAIKRLVGLQAKTAVVVEKGENIEKPIDAIVVGDILLAKPGERIALDGVVLNGQSYVDESMISGEPVPVEKTTGSQVIGGTINQSGALTYKVEQVGANTLLANIIRMVEQAQGAKLPIQALVDRITLWFVPVVMLLALLTFVVWLIFGPEPALSFALVNLVAVLIIACPCAMGLATPTSIMVGTGRAAQMGVLFRKGEALQSLKDAKVVALDKTGTLTQGRPELTDFICQADVESNQALALVAAVENQSEHPIAQAIVQAAKEKQLELPVVEQFNSITGFGVEAVVAGQRVEIGADRYMQKLGLNVADFAEQAQRLAEEGKTPLYAAIAGKLAVIIAVADPIKDSTPAAIAALHELGLKVAMITGDNRHTAQAIAKQLNIDEVVAEVLPDGKVAAITRLQQAFGSLAYVGDGINDAPALASADVGLAIGTGTDIAIEAADVVLMSGDLTGVPNAIGLSQATLANIKQNLFWAFAYNSALIPIAAGVLYPINGMLLSPIFAAGAMALSSVFVLTNALRLRRYKAVYV